MRIVFKGKHSVGEAAESVLSILKLFKERYGIECFKNINLDVALMDQQGQDVELVDSASNEVLSTFEVYKSLEEQAKMPKTQTSSDHQYLKLVVDNTK